MRVLLSSILALCAATSAVAQSGASSSAKVPVTGYKANNLANGQRPNRLTIGTMWANQGPGWYVQSL
jgi:hypothetical protein